MNVGYFDTSFVLSIVFEEVGHEKNTLIWKKSNLRFSSVLLKFEGLNNIRKHSLKSPQKTRQKDLGKTKDLFLKMMEEVNFMSVDDLLYSFFSEQETLQSLRTLDAIHISTILKLRRTFPEIALYTLDDRMAEVSENLGIRMGAGGI